MPTSSGLTVEAPGVRGGKASPVSPDPRRLTGGNMEPRRYHVLIVAGGPEDREMYRRLLSQAGGVEYAFREAASGGEGVRLCRGARPDCVLLDCRLPDREGLDVLEELTGAAAAPVPVVLLSGPGDEAVAARALKHGAQDYLVKDGLTAADLAGAVRHAVEGTPLLRRLERARQRFRLALDASPAATVLVDAEGRIVLANRQTEKLFGHRRGDLPGRPAELLFPERFRGGRRDASRGAPPAPPPGAGRELYALRRDGTEFPAQVDLTPLEADEGPMAL